MNKIPRMAALIALVVATLQAWGAHYSYTFNGHEFSGSEQTASLGGINWTLVTDGGYFGGTSAKGFQMGSSKKPARSLTLVSTGLTGNVTSVKVTTCGANGISATLAVSVGTTAFGTPKTLTAASTELSFTGNATGEVTLTYNQTSAKAIYISQIEITTGGTPAPPPTIIPTVTSIAAFIAQPLGSEARLYLPVESNARVTFVDGQNVYVRDATGALCLSGCAEQGIMEYNQHLAGYIRGRRSSIGNVPVMEATSHTSILRLLIAAPVDEPNVEPISITASQLSQHYADWVMLSNVTMTDASTGQDATGNVKLDNTFHQSGYQAPTSGSKVNVSGIVTSSTANDDILSLAGNKAKARTYNPTGNFTHTFPFMTITTTNGIDAINSSTADYVVVYDLSGRRVATATAGLSKGVYIIKGRKVVIK